MAQMDAETGYCGCCGGDLDGNSDLWCKRCADHVLPDRGVRLWDRTYFAQHGKDCPFQMYAATKEKTDG